MPAWATISCGSYASIGRASASAIGGRPRPPWIKIGTFRPAASSNTGASRSSSSRNFCARGCSLIPRAPASRQRVASSIGLSPRSSRTNGISSPPLAAAKASVRSLGALKLGRRSGSSRQKTNERVIECARWIRSNSSSSPRIPSMSRPRWTWASKISTPSGSSARTTSSKVRTRSCERLSTSSTRRSVRTRVRARIGCSPSGGLQSSGLRSQVVEVRLRVDLRRADGAIERLARRELPPVPVEPLPQPVVERQELTGFELGVQVGQLPLERAPDLHREHVPERVRGEVAVRGARPVDVLEHSSCVVGDVDPEEVLHARVPCLRQVGERERARHELLLELEAEDDVKRVRDLVGVDADQSGRDAVDAPVPGVEVDLGQLREVPLQLRQAAPPEWQRAPDEVLPRPALRLAEAERGVAVERSALEGRGDALVGQAVPRLVHRRPECAQVVRPVP